MSENVFFRRLVIMVGVVLPVVTLVAALMFWLYPGETATFTELWLNAATLVLVGPSVLAIALVLAHPALTRWLRTAVGLGDRVSSVLGGASLGFVLGAAWSLIVFWGASVAILGALAGFLYGALAPRS